MSIEVIAGTGPILLLCDHASNAVPAIVDLGVHASVLERHIAYDLGTAPLTRVLAARLGAPAILGGVSRLVLDLNRSPDSAGLIPVASDGEVIPGNADADRVARIAAFYTPYHRAVTTHIRQARPGLIAAVHSFTPRLEAGNAPARRWQIGILSNRDRRAADQALAFLAGTDLIVGDNEPYSGRQLNATLNRHGEGQGIPSFSIEVRNDLLSDADGVARWTDLLAAMLASISNGLASAVPPAT